MTGGNVARSGCIYGPTGSFKTTQVKWFARYIADVTSKATLLLSVDGGGWGSCQPEIDAGMIIPYRAESNVLPLPILRKISQGFWPRDTSVTEPAEIDLIPVDWDMIGGIAVEGWTSIGGCVMRYLPDKGINVGGEDRSKLSFRIPLHVGGVVVNEAFGSNTRGDYGFVQNLINGLVMNWNALPCHYVLYTALESKTEDDDRSTTFGPAIPGKKGTRDCGAWIGDLIHAQDYPKVETVKVPDPLKPNAMMDQEITSVVCRYYFVKHPDPATGIPFPAKPRITPEKVKALMQRFPGGYFEPNPDDDKNSFADYLRTVDSLNAAQAASGDAGLTKWRQMMDKKLGRTQP
jgi:hypothetical protein